MEIRRQSADGKISQITRIEFVEPDEDDEADRQFFIKKLLDVLQKQLHERITPYKCVSGVPYFQDLPKVHKLAYQQDIKQSYFEQNDISNKQVTMKELIGSTRIPLNRIMEIITQYKAKEKQEFNSNIDNSESDFDIDDSDFDFSESDIEDKKISKVF
jgi:hypothetical protein